MTRDIGVLTLLILLAVPAQPQQAASPVATRELETLVGRTIGQDSPCASRNSIAVSGAMAFMAFPGQQDRCWWILGTRCLVAQGDRPGLSPKIRRGFDE